MFFIHKTDTGAVPPWEYLPAVASTYQAGQLLNAVDGELTPVSAASTTTPGYLCMASITIAAGQLLPVTRIQHTAIYETQMSAETDSAASGKMLQVSAGGLQVDDGAAGSFEVTYIEDASAGSMVRGRFH